MFDVLGARKEGYSDKDIAEYLSKLHNYNIQGAIREGYSYADITDYLSKKPITSEVKFRSDMLRQGISQEEIEAELGGIQPSWIDPVTAAVAGTVAPLTMGAGLVRSAISGTAAAVAEPIIGQATEFIQKKVPKLALPFNVLAGILSGMTAERFFEKSVMKALTQLDIKPTPQNVKIITTKIKNLDYDDTTKKIVGLLEYDPNIRKAIPDDTTKKIVGLLEYDPNIRKAIPSRIKAMGEGFTTAEELPPGYIKGIPSEEVAQARAARILKGKVEFPEELSIKPPEQPQPKEIVKKTYIPEEIPILKGKKLPDIPFAEEKLKVAIETPGFRRSAEQKHLIDIMMSSMEKKASGEDTTYLYSGIHPQMFKTLIDKWDTKTEEFIYWLSAKTPKSFKRFWNPLSTLKEGEKYYIERLQLFGKYAELENTLKDTVDKINELSPILKNKAYRYLIGETIPKSIKGEQMIAPAIEAKKLINQVGEDLVERGILTPEQYAMYKDKYLPRLYLKYILEQPTGRFKGSKLDLSYAKTRKDIPEPVRKLILGEVKDPGYLVGETLGREIGDVHAYDFLDTIARNPEWAYRGSLSPWESYQAILDIGKKMKPVKRLYTPQFIREEIWRLRENIAKNPEIKTQLEEIIKEGQEILSKMDMPHHGEGWVQIPNSKRYGSLRGMYVREEIANDLKIGIGFDKQVRGILEKATTYFKISKVPLNFPTQVRNFVSNSILLDLSGMPYHEQAKYAFRVINEIRNNGLFYKSAKKFGITKTTFTNEELAVIRSHFRGIEGGIIDKTKDYLGKKLDIPLSLYQKIEEYGKLMRFMYGVETEGLSPEKAALKAQKALFDYSLVSPVIEKLRRIPLGSPFITFQYKVLPLLAETAIQRPWKFVKYAVIPYAMLEITKDKYQVSDEDFEKLRKMLPDYINKTGVWVLPWKQGDRWNFMNFEYFLPWGNIHSMAEDVAEGKWDELRKDTGIFGGPVPQLISAISTNRDPYTKKRIWDEELDNGKEKFMKMMEYIYTMSMPTMITDIGIAGHMYDYFKDRTDKYGVPLEMKNIIPRAFGINIYPMSEQEARQFDAKRKMARINKLREEIFKKGMSRTITEEERKKILQKGGQRIQELIKEFE